MDREQENNQLNTDSDEDFFTKDNIDPEEIEKELRKTKRVRSGRSHKLRDDHGADEDFESDEDYETDEYDEDEESEDNDYDLTDEDADYADDYDSGAAYDGSASRFNPDYFEDDDVNDSYYATSQIPCIDAASREYADDLKKSDRLKAVKSENSEADTDYTEHSDEDFLESGDEDFSDYEEYDNYEYDEDYEDESPRRGFLSGIDTSTKILVASGVLILAIIIAGGAVYFTSFSDKARESNFEDIGAELADVEIIGDEGLTALVNARANYVPVTETEEETPQEEVPEESTEIVLDDSSISVAMKTSTIQSDIKVKFTNSSTGKLIPGVPFSINVSGDNGKSYDWSDEDKDGIIYHTDVPNGTYKITMTALSTEEYEKYSLQADASSITVTDKIAYKKVDVADEIKTEAEVNTAAEDTAVQDTVQESANTDTVEWVESSKTLISGSEDGGYSQIDKSDVVSPNSEGKAEISGLNRFTVTWQMPYVGTETDTSTDTAEKTDTSANTDTSTDTTGTDTSTDTTKTDTSTDTTKTDTSTDTTKTDTSTDTTKTDTSTDTTKTDTSTDTTKTDTSTDTTKTDTSTDTTKTDTSTDTTKTDTSTDTTKTDTSTDTTKTDTSTDTTKTDESKPGLSVSATSLSLKVGNTGSVTPKITGTDQTDVVWSIENSDVASIDDSGNIKGVKAGTTTVTVKLKSDESVTATFTVEVTEEEKADSSTKLKDKDGDQVYVKDSDGNFREATAADYDTATAFYLKGSTENEDDSQKPVYKYTGWQTLDGYTYYFDKDGNYVTGEQVIQGAKYSFNSEGHLSTGSGTMGIDVSRWNGSIDWNAVKNSGVSYVIIRCGYRGSTSGALIEDPKFKANVSGAKAAGLSVGAYFYTQAVNEVEAVEEASMAVSLCSGCGLTLPIFLDVEKSGGRGDAIDSSTRTAVCKAFCQTVQNSGYTAGIYANKTWLTSKMSAGSLSGYKIWLAQYSATRTYSATRVDYWQYSSKGSVAGISGKVDLNIRY